MGVVGGLVLLQGHVQIVGVLARHLGVAGVDRLGKALAMAAEAGPLLDQGRHLGRRVMRLGGAGGRRGVRLVIGGHIGDILVTQGLRHGAHGRVAAVPLAVGLQRGSDVGRRLAGDLGHLVHLRKTGLVAGDAMTADAHSHLASPRLGIALHSLRGGGRRRTSDKHCKHRGPCFHHFVHTILCKFSLGSAWRHWHRPAHRQCALAAKSLDAGRTRKYARSRCSRRQGGANGSHGSNHYESSCQGPTSMFTLIPSP